MGPRKPYEQLSRTMKFWRDHPSRYVEYQRGQAIKRELKRKPRIKKQTINQALRHIERRYGLTIFQYNQMLATQGDVCAVCHQKNTPAHRNGKSHERVLAVDHDHITGKIRGLLCHRCNYIVGTVESDLGGRARRYLRQFDVGPPGVPPQA